jgi:ATP-dependent helicase HrpA
VVKQSKFQISYPAELPVTQSVDQIKDLISEHQVVILCGETGSGKTTQLPKICLDLGRGQNAIIGHTQPRRIAARSVAARIADELDVELGKEVGFKVRFSDQTNHQTAIKVMTDGVLLAETQTDPKLLRYDTIIIDEAHERNLNIDFLIGYLKKLLPQRADLKVIITSATIDVDRFSQHFNKAPVINIEGRTYPVELEYRPMMLEEEGDVISLEDSVFSVIKEIGKKSGDILVFLPGEKDIHDIKRYLTDALDPSYEVLPLFSRLAVADQQKIFQSSTQKRIILSTNIAETSLTVPNIKFVIDSGLARVVRYNPRLKIEQLLIEKVSQAAANQRKGRCGRIAPGVCYRLYDEDDFNKRAEFTDPEILRSSLASVILRMANLNLGDVELFPFLEPPLKKFIQDGYDLLFELHAVDQDKKITPLGKVMSTIPIDPIFSRMIIEAKEQHCLTEVIPIIAAITVADPIERPFDKLEQAEKSQLIFHDPQSGFLSFYKLWTIFNQEVKQKKIKELAQFCKKFFLSFTRMREWQEMFKQLSEIVNELGYRWNNKAATYDQIHISLLSGLLRNVGMKEIDSSFYNGARGIKFLIGPKLYRNKKYKWIVAAEIVDTGKLYAQCIAEINIEWVEKLALHLLESSYSNPRWNQKLRRVDASEKLTLFGLIIVPNRTIHYGPVAPIIAKEIFIREGLVEGGYESSGKFWQENKKLIKEIETLEHKSRRRDILINDEVLYAFYDKKINTEIINGDGFEFWRKTIEQKEPKHLYLTKEFLMQHSAQEITEHAYPNQMKIDGESYRVKYHFEPGHARDGVTLVIPLDKLNGIETITTDWLVPGLLREKTEWALKNLPKNLKNKCIPLKEWIDKFLHFKKQATFRDTFNLFVREYLDPNFMQVDEVLHEVPNHLNMKFEVVNDRNLMIDLNTDIELLRKEHQKTTKKVLQKIRFKIEEDNLTTWSFGDLPLKVEEQINAKIFKGFTALIDHVTSVSIAVYDNEQQAIKAHQKGIKRLLMLHFKERVKRLTQKAPGIECYGLRLATIISPQDLSLNIVDIIFNALVDKNTIVRTKDEFEFMVQKAKNELPRLIDEVTLHLDQVSLNYAEIKALQEKLSYSNEISEEIEEQLELLLPPYEEPLFDIQHLSEFPRYLKALKVRMQKYPQNTEKDFKNQQAFERLKNKWIEKVIFYVEQGLSIPPEFIQFQWDLQELRVSFFAQELKTLKPISIQRMDKEWDRILKKYH